MAWVYKGLKQLIYVYTRDETFVQWVSPRFINQLYSSQGGVSPPLQHKNLGQFIGVSLLPSTYPLTII